MNQSNQSEIIEKKYELWLHILGRLVVGLTKGGEDLNEIRVALQQLTVGSGRILFN